MTQDFLRSALAGSTDTYYADQASAFCCIRFKFAVLTQFVGLIYTRELPQLFRLILSTSHRSHTAMVHNVARTPPNRRKGINSVQNGVWNSRAVIKQCRLRDWKFEFA